MGARLSTGHRTNAVALHVARLKSGLMETIISQLSVPAQANRKRKAAIEMEFNAGQKSNAFIDER